MLENILCLYAHHITSRLTQERALYNRIMCQSYEHTMPGICFCHYFVYHCPCHEYQLMARRSAQPSLAKEAHLIYRYLQKYTMRATCSTVSLPTAFSHRMRKSGNWPHQRHISTHLIATLQGSSCTWQDLKMFMPTSRGSQNFRKNCLHVNRSRMIRGYVRELTLHVVADSEPTCHYNTHPPIRACASGLAFTLAERLAGE